jgi:hypothetical protein
MIGYSQHHQHAHPDFPLAKTMCKRKQLRLATSRLLHHDQCPCLDLYQLIHLRLMTTLRLVGPEPTPDALLERSHEQQRVEPRCES